MPSDELTQTPSNESPKIQVEEKIVASIVCNQKSNGMTQFAMNGELKDLAFMYYSIGLHINKIIADQQEKFKAGQAK